MYYLYPHNSLLLFARKEKPNQPILIGEAVRTNKGFLSLRRLEAARDIANLLAASGNRISSTRKVCC